MPNVSALFRAVLFLALFFFTLTPSFATIRVVMVGQGGSQFVPASLNACVGDTLRFTWSSGFHTVTSTTIPGGAAPFDQQLNSGGVTVFDYVATVTGSYAYECIFHPGMVGSFQVSAAPPTPLAGNNGPLCAGATLNLTASLPGPASYVWSGPGGFASTLQNPSIANATPLNAGTYLVATVANGCTSAVASTQVSISPTPSQPTASSNSPLCSGQTLSLNASLTPGATGYIWSGPDGFASTQQNPTLTNATAAATGTYSVIAVAGACTSSAGTVAVTVNPIPNTPVASNNGPLCEGAEATLTADNGGNPTYVWTGPNGFGATGQQATVPNVTPANEGVYSVVAVANGCTSSVGTTTLAVFPAPTPVIQANGNQLTTGSFASYQWVGPQGPIAGATADTYTPTQNGFYTVQVVGANGCEAESDPFEVTFVVGRADALPLAGSSLWPNPTNGHVHIGLPAGYSGAVGLCLYNGLGQQVYAQHLEAQAGGASTNLAHLPPGVYTLRLATAAGTAHHRVVLAR